MIAEVIVDITHSEVDKVFDYHAIENTQAGMRVSVPFANRVVQGVVLSLSETTSYDESKIQFSITLTLATTLNLLATKPLT